MNKCLSQQDFLKNIISRLLNRVGIADLHLNPQEPGFWEVVDTFVLLAYASLSALEPFCND